MEEIVELLEEVDIIEIFIIFAGGDDKLDKSINGLEGKIDKLSDRVDRLGEKVEDNDRRLCRIEGSLSTYGHCLFNQAKPEQKAQ